MGETVAEVLVGKYLTERKPHSYKLEAYKEKPVFIPMNIKEDVVESVARKLLGSTGPSGTNSGALQGWLLKFGDHSKKLRISV